MAMPSSLGKSYCGMHATRAWSQVLLVTCGIQRNVHRNPDPKHRSNTLSPSTNAGRRAAELGPNEPLAKVSFEPSTVNPEP